MSLVSDQYFYSIQRIKKAAAIAAFRTGAVLVTAKVVVSVVESIFDSNPTLRVAVVNAARSQAALGSFQAWLARIVVHADLRCQTDRSLSFAHCCFEGILVHFGVSVENIEMGMVWQLAAMPFLVDALLLIPLFAVVDHATRPYIPRLLSEPANAVIAHMSSMPPQSAAHPAANISSIAEFDHHYTYWWFGGMIARMVRLRSVISLPCNKLGYGDAAVVKLSYNVAQIDRTRSVLDQIVLRFVWEMVAGFVSAVHQAVAVPEGKVNKFVRHLYVSAMRSAAMCALAVLLGKLTNWSPYSCGLLASTLGNLVVGTGLQIQP